MLRTVQGRLKFFWSYQPYGRVCLIIGYRKTSWFIITFPFLPLNQLFSGYYIEKKHFQTHPDKGVLLVGFSIILYLSLSPSPSLCINLFVCLSICLSIYLFVCLPVSICIYLYLFVSINLSICLFIFSNSIFCQSLPSIVSFFFSALYLSLSLFITIFVSISITILLSLSIPISISFSFSISISIAFSIHPSILLSERKPFCETSFKSGG